MPFKTHIRRLTQSSRSSDSSTSTSTSSSPLSSSPTSGTSTPLSSSPTSTISSAALSNSLSKTSSTLSKTSSRLSLTKSLTWTTKGKERKRLQRLADWEACDEEEWRMPKCSGRKGGRGKDKNVQELVRGWSMEFGGNPINAIRTASLYSGVSPCTSRMNSLDGGASA